MSYLGCAYPDCGDGHEVGSKFCPKHKKTPFTTKAEVNAYRRGVRDGRAFTAAPRQASERFKGIRGGA